MPRPVERPRLRKREIVLAVAAGGIAAAMVAGILDDDGGSSQRIAVESGSSDIANLAPFEGVSTVGPQDVAIAYGETQTVHVDGATRSLEILVEDGQLIIRPRDGWDWARLNSTKVSVTLPRLNSLSLNGTGDVTVDQVKGDSFTGLIEGFAGDVTINGLDVDNAEFTINGAGEISAAGTARNARIVVNGPGEVRGGDLHSQTAAVTVRGPGEVELDVARRANVVLAGPGEIDIDGGAQCSISASGPGSVSCGDGDSD
jgi:hypothetical protein